MRNIKNINHKLKKEVKVDIIKQGTNGETEARTRIMMGDILNIQFPKDPSSGCLLLQVERPRGPKLRFENAPTNDGRVLVPYRDPTKESAKYLMAFICQITGLEAELINESATSLIYVVKEGKQVFSE